MPDLATPLRDMFCFAQRNERFATAGHVITSFTDFSGAVALRLNVILVSP
jgi:hypothetical protein